MSLAILGELKPVFEVAQEPVSRHEAAELGGRQHIFVAQTREREHGSTVPHPGDAPAMQALQALHQKLDIADAAGSELDIECRLAQFPATEFLADALTGDGDSLDGARNPEWWSR